MRRALWLKTIHEGKWLLIGSAVLLFAFHWIHVWITSQFQTAQMRRLIEDIPPFVKGLLPVSLDVFVTTAGRLAVAYDDPLVITVISIWAIARGSDCVSGELGRGTMEMLLAQPVRRISVLVSSGVVTIAGAALLALAGFLGTWVGLATITLEETVSPRTFLPAMTNVFALGVFLAGITTMVSACDRYRSRTIGVVIGFFVVEMIVKLVGVSVPRLEWLQNWTFLTAFEPQQLAHAFWPEMLATQANEAWSMLLKYNGLLIGLGMVGYIAAAIVFCRRDLPAPL